MDELGKLVAKHSKLFTTLPWTEFVHKVRGRSCIAPLVGTLEHPAANLLEELRSVGAPVMCVTPEWSANRRDHAAKRGSHPSAQAHHEFVSEEMQDMIDRQYWVVLPYKLVRSLPNLRISPLGVVPQRERRPRIIVDYTFSGVNDETDPHAFREAMQFVRAHLRIIQAVLFASAEHGPIYLLKIDLSDGFYRVNVKAEDIPRLGVALPKLHHQDPSLIAFPLVLPMGWTESPPHFTSATETIVDLANRWAPTWDPPRHPLETLASTAPPPFGDRVVITAPPPRHPSEVRSPLVHSQLAEMMSVGV